MLYNILCEYFNSHLQSSSIMVRDTEGILPKLYCPSSSGNSWTDKGLCISSGSWSSIAMMVKQERGLEGPRNSSTKALSTDESSREMISISCVGSNSKHQKKVTILTTPTHVLVT